MAYATSWLARVMLALAFVGAVGLGIAGASSPSQTCQANKNKEAGKYANCRHKAEAKLATRGDTAAHELALEKCSYKLAVKWPLLESKAGGTCPSTGDQASIRNYLDTTTANVAAALAGGALEDCDGDLLACQGDLGTCTTDLMTCQAGQQGRRLKTGETACYDTAGTVIPCAGTGQDGELQKGLARAYVDNGDGTITDTTTGLMWEKLGDDGSIHDKDTYYNWADAVAVKVAALNSGGGFAGYTDWRMPNVNELQSLVDYGAVSPAVSPAFNTGCVPACTVTTCSCTKSYGYWSSSTFHDSPSWGWFVYFVVGGVYADAKTAPAHVRAVRGGS